MLLLGGIDVEGEGRISVGHAVWGNGLIVTVDVGQATRLHLECVSRG